MQEFVSMQTSTRGREEIVEIIARKVQSSTAGYSVKLTSREELLALTANKVVLSGATVRHIMDNKSKKVIIKFKFKPNCDKQQFIKFQLNAKDNQLAQRVYNQLSNQAALASEKVAKTATITC